METQEAEREPEQEPELQELLWKKIKKEPKRRGSTSAYKPPQPEVTGKRKSKYSAQFYDINDLRFVKCKYCSKLIRASSKNGTTALKNHLERCKKYPINLDKRRNLIHFVTRIVVNEDGSVQIISIPKC